MTTAILGLFVMIVLYGLAHYGIHKIDQDPALQAQKLVPAAESDSTDQATVTEEMLNV